MRFESLRSNEDFITRKFEKSDYSMCLYYFCTVCNEEDIFKKLIPAFYNSDSAAAYELYVRSFPSWALAASDADAIPKLLSGSVAVMLNEQLFLVEIKNYITRAVDISTEENVLQGPKDGLSENLDTSINLIRNRYRSEALRAESHHAGNKSNTKLVMMFDEQLIDKADLAAFKLKVAKVQVDIVQSAGQLQKNLIQNKLNLFPLFLTTERPDRVVRSLSEGKIILLLEGSSWALIGPVTFFDFFKSMDDPVQMPIIGQFLVSIRYIALLITLVLPALYISIISYSPDLLKVQFALLVAGSRMSVPFPSYIELIFMLIMTEFLIEASIRLPKTISPTATTVGGLILGQAATQAGLVADVMIIVISAVAISNFVVPVNAMHQAIRIIRYPLILFASFLGTIGVVVGLLALVAYLCSLKSLGRPYFKLL
ncbi:spore germination protein [Paenibacillus albus]|uniref:Spore germination protein n=1 Tax=Paenibacillus albus TaxID=2495582 RepID=A0A3S9A658_9BACL|nr:spore germination protein [Paenibacillus albus]AZN41249.1 spore germination protein [Paenibacillus albus]